MNAQELQDIKKVLEIWVKNLNSLVNKIKKQDKNHWWNQIMKIKRWNQTVYCWAGWIENIL